LYILIFYSLEKTVLYIKNLNYLHPNRPPDSLN